MERSELIRQMQEKIPDYIKRDKELLEAYMRGMTDTISHLQSIFGDDGK